eukprot:2031683-Rhodomonas_salina.2
MRKFTEQLEPDSLLGALDGDFKLLTGVRDFLTLTAAAATEISRIKQQLSAAINKAAHSKSQVKRDKAELTINKLHS